ncbi:MAG TPA: DUF6328 family protein [Nocardioidaceae bacterium]|nr:DUF6328 family protein [Nocardioidaceae bacterium]
MADDDHTTGSHGHRLDRELNELLQELRVIQGGILLLVGFLLVIAFSSGFQRVTDFQKVIYYVTLLVTGIAAIVVISPVVHHRLAFRKHDKERIVVRGNLMLLIAIVLASFSILGITVLVSDVLWGSSVTITFGVLTFLLTVVMWLVLPLHSIWSSNRLEP